MAPNTLDNTPIQVWRDTGSLRNTANTDSIHQAMMATTHQPLKQANKKMNDIIMD